MEVFPLLVFIFSLVFTKAQKPECQNSQLLPRADNRYLFNRIKYDEKDLNDDSVLVMGWYKTDGFQILQTQPTGPFMCGTKFPVYYQGSLPTSVGQTVSGQACVFYGTNVCAAQPDVDITKCADNTYRYKLQRLAIGGAAYCFGEGVDGPKTDYIPRVGPITYQLVQTGFEYRVHFTCNFVASTAAPGLWYRVLWYNGNNPLYLTPFGQDKNQLKLTEQLFVDQGFKMGTSISCAVRAFAIKDGPSGSLSARSPWFFVGLQVDKQEISFQPGDSDSKRTFTLTPTIPIGCVFTPNCKIFLEAVIPVNSFTQCSGVTVNGQCGIYLEAHNSPHRSFKLVVEDAYNGLYQASDGKYRVLLKTHEFLAENLIWKDYSLNPLYVNILKSPTPPLIQGKTCYARNDPHMSSFDGKRYEMQNRDDVYVLYKNQNFNAEVQLQVQSCNNNNKAPRCNCGIAVRSGNDLYVASICRSNPGGVFFDFKNCVDKSITVQRSTRSQFEYQIVFEYGTRIEFHLDKTRMNYVQVKPSTFDTKSPTQIGSRGLCGVLNGNQIDDFTDRNDNVVATLPFTESWRVPVADNLFLKNKAPLVPTKTINVCLCEASGLNPGTNPGTEISCATNAVATCLQQVTGAIIVTGESCNAPSRGRRSVHGQGKKPFIQAPEPDWVDKRVRRQANVYTEATARKFCTSFMQRSKTYQQCGRVPNVNPDASIETCILDLVATNDNAWAQANLDAMQSSCLTEVISNVSMWTTSTTGAQSMRDTIQNLACPSNCNGHGECNKGQCRCATGYGASDCSIDLTKPPSLQGVFDNGLCDQARPKCTQIHAFGFDFVDSPSLTCRLEEFFLGVDQTTPMYSKTHFVRGKLDTFLEIICPLDGLENPNFTETTQPPSREMEPSKAFVKGYRLSVSNDRQLYSTAHNVYLFDSTCQVAKGETRTRQEANGMVFLLKDGYCFINGRCYEKGARNDCLICDPARNTHGWSNTGKTCDDVMIMPQ